MADKVSPLRRSLNMRQIKNKGMKPELAVRSLIHGLGYRYRLHRKDLPGKPDLVFGRQKKVIFVHGCFWHQHDDTDCKISRVPKSNKDYWLPKLSGNVERDKKQQFHLGQLGWEHLIVWEYQLRNEENLKKTIKKFLNN